MGGVLGPGQIGRISCFRAHAVISIPTTSTKWRAVPKTTKPGRKGILGAVGLERLPQIVSIVRGGGRERGQAPFPAPASGPPPAPAPPPAPPPLRLAPTAAPSSRSWCCGAAEPHVAVSMAPDPSAKVREAWSAGGGRAGGRGRTKPCPRPFHPPR